MADLVIEFTDRSITTYKGVLECKTPAENDNILMATLEGEGHPLVMIFPLSAIKYAAYGEVD